MKPGSYTIHARLMRYDFSGEKTVQLLARAQITLYDFEKKLSEAGKRKLESVSRALGEALKSFDAYREDAPQLDFLMSFRVYDAKYSELDENAWFLAPEK